MSLLLGYDLGSSSVKATLLDAESGSIVGSATSPDQELEIIAEQPGWAEQHPETWWKHIKASTARIAADLSFDAGDIKAIGISYQMHGLVLVDKDHNVLRPSIIWCDSRAVSIGDAASDILGADWCLDNLLNLPGNFTATRLKWVKDNEPDLYARIHKMMLPGDYVAMKMTDRICTTVSGLSEGILWNFKQEAVAGEVLESMGLSGDLLAETVPTFSVQGELTPGAADELGLTAGIPVAYRGGDQPNNALSLNVFEPGEVAVTAGTSGVVYGVIDQPKSDPQSRVNVFVHVNHAEQAARYGVLLCVSGTGILNSWLKRNVAGDLDYAEMDKIASAVAVGSDGLRILPFGNGAERVLGNRNPGASIHGIGFNTHDRAHLLRAGQEGIACALNYGVEIMRGTGMEITRTRAGHANMFLSPLFAEAFATLTGSVVELYDTDGSQGAARGGGIGVGLFTIQDAFTGLRPLKQIEPDSGSADAYRDLYDCWNRVLNDSLNHS